MTDQREIEARAECTRRGIDPDEICADGGVLAWMVVEKELPCPACGNEERGQGGYLTCECPAVSVPARHEGRPMTEDQKHALYAAYKGISVLAIMCRKAGLSMGEQRSKDLMNELAEAFPELPGLLAIDR